MIKEDIFEKIQETKKIIESGLDIFMPYNWKLFNRVFPSQILEPTIISGASSAAKSSLARWLYLQKSVEYSIETNTSFKIIWFALEDTVEIIEQVILCYLYYKTYNEIIDIKLLNGIKCNKEGKKVLITDDQIRKMLLIKDLHIKHMSRIKVIDSSYTTVDIYKECLLYASTRGKFYFRDKLVTEPITLTTKWTKYIQDKKEFVSVVIDNVNLLDSTPEEQTLYNSMSEMSSNYGKKRIVKGLGWHFCQIAQQSEENSSLDHQKANAIFPTERGISECKRITKDSRIMLGVTNVWKANQKTIFNYDLEKTRGFIRVINSVKNTFGSVGDYFVCLFNPMANFWWILPTLRKGETVSPEIQEFIDSKIEQILDYEYS